MLLGVIFGTYKNAKIWSKMREHILIVNEGDKEEMPLSDIFIRDRVSRRRSNDGGVERGSVHSIKH